ncbi:SulP family inorganic anion transporter [Sulfurospirillum sp.]|nr:SulP family inorganic anion transporter [Sulfurospirillum sp.]
MKNIKGDIFGGITAAIIALPLALAFGVASGAGAVAGLYGAIVLGFIASIFGGTSTQISGPTGPMTVVFASAIAMFSGNINAVMSVVFLTGIFQILFGVFKLGKYVRYIPYPVISGFMSGIGLIIIILQINPFFGVNGDSSVLKTLYNLPFTLSSINTEAFIIAMTTLIITICTPKKISKIVPSPLIALIVVTSMSIYLGFDVKTIGEIPTTLPNFILPTFEINQLRDIVILAFTLAILGCIDTLLTSLVADSITKTKHNSNKELIGQGIGNTLVSLVGGLAGAGATMRTVINVKSGGNTKLSGIIHSLTILIAMMFMAPIVSQIPLALLAGILMKVGIDILDYKFLRIIKNAPKYDLYVMVVVFVLTVFVDLIMAVGVGIVLASLLIVYRISKESNIQILECKEDELQNDKSNTRILNITGAFFFGSASIFEDQVNEVLDTKHLIVNCSNAPFIDISAIFALEDMICKLNELDIKISLVLKKHHIEKIIKVDKAHIFDSVEMHEHIKDIKAS